MNNRIFPVKERLFEERRGLEGQLSRQRKEPKNEGMNPKQTAHVNSLAVKKSHWKTFRN